jgi:hypothetical protein
MRLFLIDIGCLIFIQMQCPTGYACMTLSAVADAPKVVVRSSGKENVGAQIDRLRRALEAPAEAGNRRESMVTSTSASFGTGLSVAREPSRAIQAPFERLRRTEPTSTTLLFRECARHVRDRIGVRNTQNIEQRIAQNAKLLFIVNGP